MYYHFVSMYSAVAGCFVIISVQDFTRALVTPFVLRDSDSAMTNVDRRDTALELYILRRR